MTFPHPTQATHSLLPTALKIVGAWLVAVAFAIGHHAFYASLNGKIVTTGGIDRNSTASFVVHSQAGASAIGTALASLTAATLGVSAATAFFQGAWFIVRKRAMSISALDALWSAPHNPMSILSWDMWCSVRGVVLLAAVAWAFPQTRVSTTNSSCSVLAYDFGNNEDLYVEFESASPFFFRSSLLAQWIVGATLLNGQPVAPISMCGTNCSYTVTAFAPTFSCSTSAFDPTSLSGNGVGIVYQSSSFNTNPGSILYTGLSAASSWDYGAQIQSAFPVGVWTSITCVAGNASYDLAYDFTNGPTVKILGITPQTTVLGADDATSSLFIDGNFSNPHTRYYNSTTNYYGIFQALYSYILGNITVPASTTAPSFRIDPQSMLLPDTSFINFTNPTEELKAGNFTWSSDFGGAMEDLMQNISLSLLSGTLPSTQTTRTTCTFTNTLPHFAYMASRLWLIYGLGLGVALLCDIAGLVALWRNRFGARAGFHEFLGATRNRELDWLDLAESDSIRLRYGPILSEGGRYAFARPESLVGGISETYGNSDLGEVKSTTSPFLEDRNTSL
ncbi:hypothetical protein C8J57DRAFT_1515679 [Mycena rebaudengoi]|nr:hypothetical protein C8J57DRAFT_1515679 [Mycena rebaudengoi]